MKKITWCFLLICILSFFSCTGKTLKIKYIEDPSLAKVQMKRSLVIGVDYDVAMLSFKNDQNELTGYDVEIFEALCAKMKIRPIFYPIDWSKKADMLNMGFIDCIISGFSITEERKKEYRLITPYLQNAQIIVTRAKDRYNHLADLKDKKIGVKRGSIGAATLKKIPALDSAILVEYLNFETLYEELREGNVDGIVVDLISSYNKIKTQNIYKIISEPISVEFYTFAFRKNDNTLAEKIESELKELDRQGIIPDLSKKWFGTNLSVLNVTF